MTPIIKYFPIKANKIRPSEPDFMFYENHTNGKQTSQRSMIVAQVASEMYNGAIAKKITLGK